MLAQPSYYKYGASAWDTIFIVFINSCMVQNIIKQNKVVKVAGCRCTRHNAIATINTYCRSTITKHHRRNAQTPPV